MSMTADLRDHWRGAGVADGRVYRGKRPQGTPLPAITMQVISAPIDALMKGEQALNWSRLQVNALGSSDGDADEVLTAALAHRPEHAAIGSTHFSRIYVDGGGTDNGQNEAGETIFRARADLIVWHRPLS